MAPALLISLSAGACNSLIGLAPPMATDTVDGGTARDAAATDVGDAADRSVGASMIAATGEWGFGADAVALGPDVLYALVGGDIISTSLASPPYARPLTFWSGANATSLSTDPTSLYIGTYEAIWAAPLAYCPQEACSKPTEIVDIADAFPGQALGGVDALVSDGDSVFWTQLIGGTPTLVRHQLTDPITTVTVLLAANQVDARTVSLQAVAVDATYVYTVATTGDVYAVPKGPDGGGGSQVASGALPTSLAAVDGTLYFVTGASDAGQLEVKAPGAEPSDVPAIAGAAVDVFVLTNGVIVFGSGDDIESAALVGGEPEPLVGNPSGDPIIGVAVGYGFAAYSSGTVVGVTAI